MHFGRVAEIIAPALGDQLRVLITVERFLLANNRHPTHNMPILFRKAPYMGLVAVPAVRREIMVQ